MENELDSFIMSIARAGHRLAEIGACEGAAGNLSIYTIDEIDPISRFTIEEEIHLPAITPDLALGWIIATGSGRRLRDILSAPEENLGILRIQPGGATASLYTSPKRLFSRMTSELNSHLGVHQDQVQKKGLRFHAIAHAQPVYLTYLSHIHEYQTTTTLSRRLLRWQPEAIINFPNGIPVLPYCMPGSKELMDASCRAMRNHHLIIWGQHGVMSRSEGAMEHAVDLVEYAETAARYEYMNIQANQPCDGIPEQLLRELAHELGIVQTVF